MPRRTRAGYPAFSRWELDLTAAKVRNLRGNYGLTGEDLKDLEQELLLHIYVKRQNKAYWETIRVSEKTLIDRIIDNRIRNFLDVYRQKKHQVLTRALPIHELPSPGAQEANAPYEDRIPEDAPAYGVKRLLAMEETENRTEIGMLLSQMTALQRRVARLFMKDYSTSEVARMLGMHRTTLEREKKKMLKVFRRRGMGGVL
jgi:DNA-directed RNA polymerase specialized sigma24 family protein